MVLEFAGTGGLGEAPHRGGTTLRAYVQPVIDDSIARFSDRLGRQRFKGRLAGPSRVGRQLQGNGLVETGCSLPWA